ncbi:MAG TPA: helix-turn-helix transcriptional regulator [Firmicutes bacterium]|nr:helix-turn-helix transcriptional regulator [Bacillota bacterium]
MVEVNRVPDVMKGISKKLRELREAQGLTQEQLGEKAGLNSSFVGQIERGVRQPSITTLESLASALGVSLKALFMETDTDRDKALQDLEIVLSKATAREIQSVTRLARVFLEAVETASDGNVRTLSERATR